MNNLKVFKNDLFEVAIKLENGEFSFDAETVARSLGFVKTENKDGKTYTSIRWERVNNYLGSFRPHVGEVKKGDFIPEPAVYKLAFKASNDIAEKFQDWLAIEVLPSIRKHGAYLTDEKIEEVLTDPDTIIKLATQLKEERQKRIEVEKTNNILMHVNKTYTATEIAKELGLKSANALNADLENRKIQFKQNGTWVLYSKYANRGYVEIKQEVLDNGKVIYHRRWTQLGREFLLSLYNLSEIAN